MLVAADTTRIQLERILASDTFRSAEVLRRLLKFLADRALAGEADQLKEYTIGLDAFGKPPSYDPQLDGIVRFQAGRLRQKLAEYYRTEGQNDPILIALPKGHFKLTWEPRPMPVEVPPGVNTESRLTVTHWRWTAIVLAGALLISVAWAMYATKQSQDAREIDVGSRMWTPELEQLWRPYLGTVHPLVLAFDDPTFAGFIGPGGLEALIRLPGKNQWDEITNSQAVVAVHKTLPDREMRPRFDYVGRGDLVSAFVLGKLLGSRQINFSTARISQVSWQDLSNNNMLLFAPKGGLNEKLQGLPLKPELMLSPKGVRDLRSRPGEPEICEDMSSSTTDGEVCALVSNVSGPVGNTSVGIFNSNRFWGNTGAIQALTDAKFARTLVEKLRTRTGEIPRYYQVVLKVRYRDGVPTDVSYLMHRDLGPH